MTTLDIDAVDTTLVVSTPTPTYLVADLDPPLVLEVAPIGAALEVQAVQVGTLTAPAAQGAPGTPGKDGATGATGSTGPVAAAILYPILSASSFTAAHGLPYAPSVRLLDPTGSEVEADILHAPGQVTAVFSGPFTGSLYVG